MRKVLATMAFLCVFCAVQANAQTATPSPSPAMTPAPAVKDSMQMPEKPKRVVFRATKDQIRAAQDYLKQKSMFTGDTDGAMNATMRDAVKVFQENNGLKKTGSLNRATLEKMNIPLTDTQKAIPYDESKYLASAKTTSSTANSMQMPEGGKAKRPPVFRATKEQIGEAQKMLKEKGLLTIEPTGKLDDETRAAIRKFQEQNGVKVTGTLNRETLEKMNIALNEKQKRCRIDFRAVSGLANRNRNN